LQSVRQEELARYNGREVEVQGVISGHEDPAYYTVGQLPDRSSVRVAGSRPDVYGATYVITARVLSNGTQYFLSEITKEPLGASKSLDLGGNLPFIIAGVVLILAAIITAIVMVSRNRAFQREQEHQAALQSERDRMQRQQIELE